MVPMVWSPSGGRHFKVAMSVYYHQSGRGHDMTFNLAMMKLQINKHTDVEYIQTEVLPSLTLAASKPRFIYAQGGQLWDALADIALVSHSAEISPVSLTEQKDFRSIEGLGYHFAKDLVFFSDTMSDDVYRMSVESKRFMQITANAYNVEGKLVTWLLQLEYTTVIARLRYVVMWLLQLLPSLCMGEGKLVMWLLQLQTSLHMGKGKLVMWLLQLITSLRMGEGKLVMWLLQLITSLHMGEVKLVM